MSVGICIINHNGIAMAADSAGTVGDHRMFYNSMNKIFSLSNVNTIGAISYGATRINDVLIDQILKEFRIYLDESIGIINDLDDIENHFCEFLSEKDLYYNFSFFAEKEAIENITNLFIQWKQRVDNGISLILDENNEKLEINLNQSNGSVEINPLAKIIFDMENAINNMKVNIVIDYCGDIKTFLINKIEQVITNIFPNILKYEKEKEKLIELSIKYLNIKWNTTSYLGLFITGYGNNTAFPKYIHLHVYRFFGKQLKYHVIEKGPKGDDAIIPLAQPEVIMTFCRGVSDNIQQLYLEIGNRFINSKINDLDNNIFTQDQKKILRAQFLAIPINLNSNINSIIQQQNVKPLLDGLKYLPIPEMASLAENLVNITTLRRRYVLDGNQQTVGGPTDVAVLSKGDGFIWIKRKYYFDKTLNPNYGIK